jgi:hypothetical protein
MVWYVVVYVAHAVGLDLSEHPFYLVAQAVGILVGQ